MANQYIQVGLEIGTKKTKIVVGEIKSDQSILILGGIEVPTTGVIKGEITNTNQVRECLREAIRQAEEHTSITLSAVYFAISGSHIIGQNVETSLRIPETEKIVRTSHIQELKYNAENFGMPKSNTNLHFNPTSYTLDNMEQNNAPIDCYGSLLEARYHVIHGIENRIFNSVRCVTDQSVRVEHVVFSPVAAALASLSSDDRANGAILIDIGAGTSDYIAYHEGRLVASGCIPIAGDHITNDIHLVAKSFQIDLPRTKAEDLKIREGDVSSDPARSIGTIQIKDDKGFSSIQFERAVLNEVISERLREIFTLILQRLKNEPSPAQQIFKSPTARLYLVGGTSQLRGIQELAQEIFKIPVNQTSPQDALNRIPILTDPSFATPIGLIRYAQLIDQEFSNQEQGFFRRIINKLFPFQS